MAEYRKVADSTYHLLVGSTLFGRSLIDWIQAALDADARYAGQNVDELLSEIPGDRPLYEREGDNS